MVVRDMQNFPCFPDSIEQNWKQECFFECCYPVTASVGLINLTADAHSGQNHDPSSETVAEKLALLAARQDRQQVPLAAVKTLLNKNALTKRS